MIKHTLFCLLFAPYLFAAQNMPPADSSVDDLLTVILMVKDEEKAMDATLKPFIQAGVQSFLIYDTGSTDKTIQTTQQLFIKNNIKKAKIFADTFVDFSTSRNKALQLAEKYYSNSPFFLMIDAEWYAHNVEALLDFCRDHASDDPHFHACYDLKINASGHDFLSARLLKNKSGIRFRNRVHEVVDKPAAIQIPEFFIEYAPTQESLQKSHLRWKRDKEWIKLDMQDNPNDTRLTFILGQTCHALGDLDEAITHFTAYTKFPHIDEYTYLAHYTLGEIYQEKYKREASEATWNLALKELTRAFELRPFRAEPLFKIAQQYQSSGNMPMAHIFAKRAAEIPLPAHEILAVNNDIYAYQRHVLLGISAWYAGDYEAGQLALETALEAKPGSDEVLRNLAHYQKRKKLLEPYQTRSKKFQNEVYYFHQPVTVQ